MDVEHLDLLPVRHRLRIADDDVVGAEVDAHARADVLASRLAAVGLRLLEDHAPAELGREVDVRAADELEVDPERGERRLLEVFPEVADQEVPVEVGRRRAERIVLEPVGIERLHERAGNRLLVLARAQVPADRPDAEAGEDQAPEAIRQAVLPHAD